MIAFIIKVCRLFGNHYFSLIILCSGKKTSGKDSRRSTIDTSDFLESDDEKKSEENEKKKKKKPHLKDLLNSPSTVKNKNKSSPVKSKNVSSPAAKSKEVKPSVAKNQSGFGVLEGSIKVHDNPDGPVCPKCSQVCKDHSNLRNHLLSHYYHTFYAVLPGAKPFECPECSKPNRDRITLTRHYAFTHHKFYEMTDVTPEMLNDIGKRSKAAPSKPRTPKAAKPDGQPKSVSKKATSVVSSKTKSKEIINDSEDSDDDEINQLLARANAKLSGAPPSFPPKPKVEKSKDDKERSAKKEEKGDNKEGKERREKEEDGKSEKKKHKHKEKHKKRDKSKERDGKKVIYNY